MTSIPLNPLPLLGKNTIFRFLINLILLRRSMKFGAWTKDLPQKDIAQIRREGKLRRNYSCNSYLALVEACISMRL